MSRLSIGAIIGIVLGILGFAAIKAVLVFSLCHKRRQRIAKNRARIPRRDSPEEIEAFLEQLKEHEFACHDIKICKNSEGKEIELGTGGYGRVLLAARNEHQPVAVKQLLNPDRKARSDFLNEIKLLKHVSLDANVVQYLGACFQDDQLWLVTEYMEGRDLRKALTAEGGQRLTWWNGGKPIALDTARGLAFLHSRGVIHGDMKSHNILLTTEGKAKIADVGMAHIISDRAACQERLTQMGTLAWAAPELLVKGWEYTEKVDIYAFGVCLWEIVTSQMPIRGAINVPSADDCPSGIISLIQDCMKNDPRDRPSAKEVYRRLVACEPHTLDFGGLLDSAEGGGRRSQVVPRSNSIETSRASHSRRGIRQSFQTFTTDSQKSREEASREQQQSSLEMVEQAKADSRRHRAAREAHHSDRSRASEVDEKVELKSRSPRYYRPEDAAMDTESTGRELTDHASAADGKLMSSLPSDNSAFSELVARFAQAPPELVTGPPTELQDTAILSTVDADLSHIPSLHNTLSQDPLALGETSSFSSMASGDEEAIDAWLDPAHDILSTPPPQTASSLTSPDPMFTAQEGWDLSYEGETDASHGDDTDELESAKSVQGYAGSERSFQSMAEGEATARNSLAASFGGSTSSEGNTDLTSHHLEVPQSSETHLEAGAHDSFPRPTGTPFAQEVTQQWGGSNSDFQRSQARNAWRSEQPHNSSDQSLTAESAPRARSHSSTDWETSFPLSPYISDPHHDSAMQ